MIVFVAAVPIHGPPPACVVALLLRPLETAFSERETNQRPFLSGFRATRLLHLLDSQRCGATDVSSRGARSLQLHCLWRWGDRISVGQPDAAVLQFLSSTLCRSASSCSFPFAMAARPPLRARRRRPEHSCPNHTASNV